MNNEFEALIAKAKEGKIKDIRLLLAYCYSNDISTDKARAAAETVVSCNRQRNLRFEMAAARLFRRCGDFAKEQDIYEQLSRLKYAPAIHYLGRLYVEYDYETALELFLEAKKLNYDVGASAYHTLLRRNRPFPISFYHRLKSVFYRSRSIAKMRETGAADEVMVWDISEDGVKFFRS